MPSTTSTVVLALHRPIPPRRGWTRDKHCRVLAGCYETKMGREVYVAEQIGEILGWSFWDWDGKEPVGVRLYVRVQV
jgi:hypothetical protein